MAAAEEVDDWLGQDGLDKNFQRAAANEAVVVAGFIVEVEDHLAGRFHLHDVFGGGPDFGFDAASANGSGDGAVFADEHAGAFVAGDRAVGMHDGGEGRALPGTPHLHDFFEQVHALPLS